MVVGVGGNVNVYEGDEHEARVQVLVTTTLYQPASANATGAAMV